MILMREPQTDQIPVTCIELVASRRRYSLEDKYRNVSNREREREREKEREREMTKFFLI